MRNIYLGIHFNELYTQFRTILHNLQTMEKCLVFSFQVILSKKMFENLSGHETDWFETDLP